MIHVTGAEYAWWAFLVLIGAGCVLCMVIADHTGIGRRLRQAGNVLAEAGPWFVGAVLDAMARQPDFAIPASHPAGTACCTCQGHAQALPDADEMADWYAMERKFPAPRRES